MATEKKEIQRNTYTKYTLPYLDTGKKVLTFSHVRYHIPTEALLLAMHERLSKAVQSKDYREILATIKDLAPYRANVKVSHSKRQTVEVDV